MRSLTLLSRFVTGALLANGIPHFVQGISGHAFPTPFATPPGVGDSSPLLNVVWGSANFLIAYVLLAKGRPIRSAFSLDALSLGIGFVAMALMLAQFFA